MKTCNKDQFGLDILNALGIASEGARKIVLTIQLGDIVTVEVNRRLSNDGAGKIKELMQEKYTFSVKAKR